MKSKQSTLGCLMGLYVAAAICFSAAAFSTAGTFLIIPTVLALFFGVP